MVLAPHPDDEILGCGGILQQAVAQGVPVRLVFLTYGDSNEWAFLLYRKHPVVMPKAVRQMGLVRQQEALAAARGIGLSPDQVRFLGYPDLGTLTIWYAHWAARPPFRSLLTQATAVPYESARRPGAAYTGDQLLRDLTTELRAFRPTKLFVSHPADRHPDHRALYLFTRVALWDLEAELPPPALYPYLIHCRRWPTPAGYHPDKPLDPPPALRAQIPWVRARVDPQQMVRKRVALMAHRSQYEATPAGLLSFVRTNELFGDLPDILLRPTTAPVMLAAGESPMDVVETPDQLTDEEQAALIGFEWRYVRLEGRELVLSIELSRPLAKEVGVVVYLFGYRSDQPFGDLPKLRLQLGAFHQVVYDQRRALARSPVRMTRHPRQILVRVPLGALGDPQRILTSAHTYVGELPLDWVSWRVLELPDEQWPRAAPTAGGPVTRPCRRA